MKRKPNRSRSDHSRSHRRPGIPDDALIGRHPDLSDDDFDAFLDMVSAFESAPTTTLARLLIRDGIQLPSPEKFTEESVHDKLMEVINAMARHRHFLESTDHLSNLDLYRRLWNDTLNEPTEALTPAMVNSACHIDLTGSGSEEDTQIWLRHYADEIARDLWAEDFPDDPIPPHLDPPYDRDRHLPKPYTPPTPFDDNCPF